MPYTAAGATTHPACDWPAGAEQSGAPGGISLSEHTPSRVHDPIYGSCRPELTSGEPLAVRQELAVAPDGHGTVPSGVTYYSYTTLSSPTSLELRCGPGELSFAYNPSGWYRTLTVTHILVELTSASEIQQTQAEDVDIDPGT